MDIGQASSSTFSSTLQQASPERKPRPVPFALECGDFSCQMLDKDEQPKEAYRLTRDGNTISCFVEAEEDEPFMVRVRCRTSRGRAYHTNLRLGGIKACGKCHMARHERWTYVYKDRAAGPTTRQAFYFKQPTVTADDQVDSIRDRDVAASLADVTLTIERALSIASKRRRWAEKTLSPDKPVHEQAQKVGMVNFSGGPKSNHVNARYGSKPKLDPTFPPIRFVFHCVTRLGIETRFMPQPAAAAPSSSPAKAKSSPVRPPRPSPAEQKRIDDLEEEELRLQAMLSTIKAKRVSLLDNATKREDDAAARSASSSSAAAAAPPARFGGIKVERLRWDYSQGGTADNPVLIDDDD